jgi:hypothetical protein
MQGEIDKKNFYRGDRIHQYMGSDTFKSTIYNTNNANNIPYDKISSCSDKNTIKSYAVLNNEPRIHKVNSNVGFNGKRGFFF